MTIKREQCWLLDSEGRVLFGDQPEARYSPEWGRLAERAMGDAPGGYVSVTLVDVELTAWRLLAHDARCSAPSALAVRVRPRPLGLRGRRRSSLPAAQALTPRQLEVCEYAASGATVGEIATQLGISVGTVRTHLKTVYRNLEVVNRVELARALGMLAFQPQAAE